MKCLIVFSLLTLGCALAQDYNDGRYYPELYQGKFDDGQYRPDNSGAYHADDGGRYSGRSGRAFGSGSFGQGNRFGSSSSSSLNRFSSSNSNRFATAAATPVKVLRAPAPAPAPAARFASNSGFNSQKKSFGSANGASSGDRIGVKEEAHEMTEDGYFYRFLNENNIEVAEAGRIENRGSDNEVLRAKGFYEFVGDDGVRYRVEYIADENGFQATGDHLPTPPPIPDEILESLRLLSQS